MFTLSPEVIAQYNRNTQRNHALEAKKAINGIMNAAEPGEEVWKNCVEVLGKLNKVNTSINQVAR